MKLAFRSVAIFASSTVDDRWCRQQQLNVPTQTTISVHHLTFHLEASILVWRKRRCAAQAHAGKPFRLTTDARKRGSAAPLVGVEEPRAANEITPAISLGSTTDRDRR